MAYMLTMSPKEKQLIQFPELHCTQRKSEGADHEEIIASNTNTIQEPILEYIWCTVEAQNLVWSNHPILNNTIKIALQSKNSASKCIIYPIIS